MEIKKLKSIIESILFLSGEPVSVAKISKVVKVEKNEVENALMILQGEYGENSQRGIIIVRKEDSFQMATNPQNSQIISDLVKSEIQENLSRAGLEVLSIVAYRGPIGRIDIEAIRGVNCSFTLRSLLMRGLLEKIDNPKDARAYLYKISFDFLKKMGLENVSRLPDFENLSKDARIEDVLGK